MTTEKSQIIVKVEIKEEPKYDEDEDDDPSWEPPLDDDDNGCFKTKMEKEETSGKPVKEYVSRRRLKGEKAVADNKSTRTAANVKQKLGQQKGQMKDVKQVAGGVNDCVEKKVIKTGKRRTGEEWRAKWREQQRRRRQRLTEEQLAERKRRDIERVRKKRALLAAEKKVNLDPISLEAKRQARRLKRQRQMEQMPTELREEMLRKGQKWYQARRVKQREAERLKRQMMSDDERRQKNRERYQRQVMRKIEKQVQQNLEQEEQEKRQRRIIRQLERAAMEDTEEGKKLLLEKALQWRKARGLSTEINIAEEMERRRLRRRERERARRQKRSEEAKEKQRDAVRKSRAKKKMTPEQYEIFKQKLSENHRKGELLLLLDGRKRKVAAKDGLEEKKRRPGERSKVWEGETPTDWKDKVVREDVPIRQYHSRKKRMEDVSQLSPKQIKVIERKQRVMAKETQDLRVKRLLYNRLVWRKRNLNKKLIEEGASPEQIKLELENLEATFMQTHFLPAVTVDDTSKAKEYENEQDQNQSSFDEQFQTFQQQFHEFASYFSPPLSPSCLCFSQSQQSQSKVVLGDESHQNQVGEYQEISESTPINDIIIPKPHHIIPQQDARRYHPSLKCV